MKLRPSQRKAWRLAKSTYRSLRHHREPSPAVVDGFGAWIFTTRGTSAFHVISLISSDLIGRFWLPHALGHELLDREAVNAGTEDDAALGAVAGLTLCLACHREKHLAKPVIRRIREPHLAIVGIRQVNESLGSTVTEHLDELGVILRLCVRRPRLISEIDADEPDATLAEHGVGNDPGGGTDIAAAVEARQAIGLVQPARHAARLVVVVVHRVPPVHGYAGGLAARDDGRRRRRRDRRA